MIQKHQDWTSEIILDEELVVLTAPHVRNLKSNSTSTILIVLGQESLYQNQLKAIVIRHGIEVARVIKLGTLEMIVGCVAAGLGVTLLPRVVLTRTSEAVGARWGEIDLRRAVWTVPGGRTKAGRDSA